MKILTLESLLNDFGLVIKPQMNMSIYRDNFECACGEVHWFDERIKIYCEGRMKVLVACPDDPSYLVCLKIKTFMVFKFKGFESLCGAQIKTSEDVERILSLRLAR